MNYIQNIAIKYANELYSIYTPEIIDLIYYWQIIDNKNMKLQK